METLKQLGMQVEEVTTPHINLIPAIKVCTSRVENAAAHDPYLRTRARDYSKQTLYSYISALLKPATTYVMAQRARRLVCDEFDELLKRVQLLVLPTIPFPVPSIEECQSGVIEIDGKRSNGRTPEADWRAFAVSRSMSRDCPRSVFAAGFRNPECRWGYRSPPARFRRS